MLGLDQQVCYPRRNAAKLMAGLLGLHLLGDMVVLDDGVMLDGLCVVHGGQKWSCGGRTCIRGLSSLLVA